MNVLTVYFGQFLAYLLNNNKENIVLAKIF